MLRTWLKSRAAKALVAGNVTLFLVAAIILVTNPGQDISTDEFAEEQARVFPSMAPTVDDLRVIQERPLFHESRKPRDAISRDARPQSAPVQPQLPNQIYKLTGVMDSSSGQRIAYVLRVGTEETMKVKVGDALGDWTVASMTRGALSLTREGRTFELTLSR